ncbi:hypothetical protein [Estrella lausannensis]|uniref:Uncharacterized protein n=1 Tax=Estrella lausannensis TaxID=483423 RepID=A0A0H5DNS0_9BACT|nr:hypothetical protein [Estrella lausannensis]CRX37932.1 hypothetical protein ELAC_0577 [Estrella lausannensis]
MTLYRILIAIFFSAGLTSVQGEVLPMPLAEVWHYGDALNIEAGLIPKRHLREGQIWANLCFVLDRPFFDGVELKEITKKNSYPLKETNILAFNEHKAALATALTLKYYITEGHRLAACGREESARVVVQVHRNSTGQAHLNLLRKLLELMELKADETALTERGESLTFLEHQVILELRFGVLPSAFEGAHIVISIGMAAGLHPEWKSGTVLMPYRFIPFDIHSMALLPSLSYEVKNHLCEALDAILAKQDPQLIEQINKGFASLNPAKINEQTKPLTKEDFHDARLLQVNGLFNPSEMPGEAALIR